MSAATTAMTLMKQQKGEDDVETAAREARIAEKKEQEEQREAERAAAGPCKSKFYVLMDFLNGTGLQTLLYFIFVIIFQQLAGTIRMPEEFYLDKHVMDRIIENHFDSSHNTFDSVRRIADIYEWGNNVLIPGLFADMGPCSGGYRHTEEGVYGVKSCNDDAWPDGTGSFHQTGATPFGLSQLVQRMDQFDWSEGIYVRQLRARGQSCSSTWQLGECYPELVPGEGDTASFGSNWTNRSLPPLRPWDYFTKEELGGNDGGVISAAVPSMRTYDSDGYVALAIPFFSETYLEPEEGNSSNVTDYRDSFVTPTNGRTPRFYCVRVSHNGKHLKQLCDRGANGDGLEPYTGEVRATIEEWWNDLKRGHFLDAQSRMMSIVLQLKSNNQGVRYRITLMFELTALGAILPSYDVETRILDTQFNSDMPTYANIALAMVCFFAALELFEIANNGVSAYMQDVWNVMDWLNYLIYFIAYISLQNTINYTDETPIAPSHPDCSSYLCQETGYFDDWQTMVQFRTTKMYLSLCVCIQLFNIQKFAAALIPKTGLATAVLRKAAMDLIFFGVTFIISMLAFSTMLFVQLGPVMEDYWDQFAAFIALFRALFGDFDIDEIMNNSSGYLNCLLFLGYLFVAIFIMLSMFLAILAEAQVAVREDEDARRAANPDFKDYGVLDTGGAAFSAYVTQPLTAALFGKTEASEKAKPEPAKEKKSEVTNEQLLAAISSMGAQVAALQSEVELLRSDPTRRPSSATLLPPPSPDARLKA